MNVLFLDDMQSRTKHFFSHMPFSTTVETALECIEKLKNDKWDFVFLDHDLGGETFVDTCREDCGMEVVRWIVENKPQLGQVFVHSHNFEAAQSMVNKLKTAGYDAHRCPFQSSLFNSVVQQIVKLKFPD